MKYAKLALILLLFLSKLSFISQENCFDGIDNDGDGLIDCYDSDCFGNSNCANFIIGQSTNCSYAPTTPAPFDFKEEWRTDTLLNKYFSTYTPVAGDIDGDGIVEILAMNHDGVTPVGRPGTLLYIIDGSNGNVDLTITMPVKGNANNTSCLAIADLDLDGFGEIVVLGEDSRLRCYEHNGLLKWTSGSLAPFASVPGIADFNEDGFAEIYGSNWIVNGQTGTVIITGAFPPLGIGAPLSGAAAAIGMSVAADVLPDAFCADCAGLELIAGKHVYSINISTGVRTVQTTSANGADGFTSIADYDGDGDLDGIITTDVLAPVTTFKVNVYVWDLQTPNVLFTSADFFGSTFWTIGQANVGDFDSDNKLEIGFVYPGNYVVLDDYTTGLATKWTRNTTDVSGLTKSIIFDFQGDGIQEVVYQDEDSLFVFDANSGNTLSSILCRGGTVVNHPIVLDTDGDDIAEIICGCSELSGPGPRLYGFIRSMGPDQSLWVDARAVWNQSSYFVVNVNEDLTIPAVQQDHSIVGDSIVLNGFNIQASYLDTNYHPLYAVPDASVNVLNMSTVNCGGFPNTISFDLQISNLANISVIPASTIVSIYNGDPTTIGATLISSFTIGVNVPPLSDITFNMLIPDQGGNFSMYAVVNDNGLAAPLAALSFPNSGIAECDFSNNIDLVTINSCLTLPISLENFDATLISSDIVELTWTTVSEINNDYFVIQRSVNGFDWEDIIQLDGAGNSSGVIDYKALDKNPHFGDNFYRLIQYDFNGDHSYSEVRRVYYSKVNSRVYPNPTSGQVNLEFTSNLEDVKIIVYNVIGEIVDEFNHSNISSMILDFDYQDGIYFIEILSKNEFIDKVLVVKSN